MPTKPFNGIIIGNLSGNSELIKGVFGRKGGVRRERWQLGLFP
jgi:hypothetical protein